jgi:hypothetical protein
VKNQAENTGFQSGIHVSTVRPSMIIDEKSVTSYLVDARPAPMAGGGPGQGSSTTVFQDVTGWQAGGVRVPYNILPK